MAARTLIGALSAEPAFSAGAEAARRSPNPADVAWERARRYGPGTGLRAARRHAVACVLLAAASTPVEHERFALLSLMTTATWTSDDEPGDRAKTYVPGPATLASFQRGATVVAAACAGRDMPDGATTDDLRALFDAAGPLLRDGIGVPSDWLVRLDELRS